MPHQHRPHEHAPDQAAQPHLQGTQPRRLDDAADHRPDGEEHQPHDGVDEPPLPRLLDALHDRWVRLWRSLTADQFGRVLVHPDHGPLTVDWLLFQYAWHGRHHIAHITELRKQKSW